MPDLALGEKKWSCPGAAVVFGAHQRQVSLETVLATNDSATVAKDIQAVAGNEWSSMIHREVAAVRPGSAIVIAGVDPAGPDPLAPADVAKMSQSGPAQIHRCDQPAGLSPSQTRTSDKDRARVWRLIENGFSNGSGAGRPR
jgi:hypothetical protein